MTRRQPCFLRKHKGKNQDQKRSDGISFDNSPAFLALGRTNENDRVRLGTAERF